MPATPAGRLGERPVPNRKLSQSRELGLLARDVRRELAAVLGRLGAEVVAPVTERRALQGATDEHDRPGETAQHALQMGSVAAQPAQRIRHRDDRVRDLSTGGIGAIAQEPQDPMPAMGRVHLLPELTDDVIDSLLDEFANGPSPVAAIQIRHLGGALERATADDGPVGAMAEQYLVLLGAMAPGPELPALIKTAFDDITSRLGSSITNRVPMTLSEDARIEQIFEPSQLARLREIKERVDPGHRVRGNHPLF